MNPLQYPTGPLHVSPRVNLIVQLYRGVSGHVRLYRGVSRSRLAPEIDPESSTAS